MAYFDEQTIRKENYKQWKQDFFTDRDSRKPIKVKRGTEIAESKVLMPHAGDKHTTAAICRYDKIYVNCCCGARTVIYLRPLK